ncbi:oxidoreductase [Hoeflea sp. BAL378]|uniref:NAD(P)H-dependent flavin oxidoreductase n=1 Tax=Hoeflea sp. BAL378 TaxID=1547437 RepID=UPI000513CC8D|nr:nitronate monooxygenase [Hoeflea sp. BAL378]KGF68454.1 oxidoreductase [Hoeflea sp. BAL378]
MKTRLTELFGLSTPVIQAPMAFVAGGALAAAVSRAGGLGMIGGGYGDADWLDAQFALAGNTPVGCGFISFALAEKPELLELALARQPRALFLSFADPAPFLPAIRAAGVPVIVQIQSYRDACRVLDLGIEVVVAQGGDAGGHGRSRGTMALVAEVADEISRRGSPSILCAAGGIADGRGLVAALALGAEGVVIGTRFWGAVESLADRRLVPSTLARDGDSTVRTRVVDRLRGIDWPEGYSGRVLQTAFVERWHGDEAGLSAEIDAQQQRWTAAVAAADPSIVAPFVGEAIGLLRTEESAEAIIRDLAEGAARTLAALQQFR